MIASPPLPSLCVILGPRQQVQSENVFMERYPKDVLKAKHLFWKKDLPIIEKKTGKTLWGCHPPSSLATGGLILIRPSC